MFLTKNREGAVARGVLRDVKAETMISDDDGAGKARLNCIEEGAEVEDYAMIEHTKRAAITMSKAKLERPILERESRKRKSHSKMIQRNRYRQRERFFFFGK